MPWHTSNRRQRLPADWSLIRLRVLRRDGFRCQLRLEGCAGVATEVDHITRGDDHSESNLQGACSVCHRKKTLREALEASRKKRDARFRPKERHPGAR